uniref:CD276 molecule n=1 Tax=Naja naja TaxID=35670 RepID=A0A8C6Y1F9_NAJNA
MRTPVGFCLQEPLHSPVGKHWKSWGWLQGFPFGRRRGGEALPPPPQASCPFSSEAENKQPWGGGAGITSPNLANSIPVDRNRAGRDLGGVLVLPPAQAVNPIAFQAVSFSEKPPVMERPPLLVASRPTGPIILTSSRKFLLNSRLLVCLMSRHPLLLALPSALDPLLFVAAPSNTGTLLSRHLSVLLFSPAFPSPFPLPPLGPPLHLPALLPPFPSAQIPALPTPEARGRGLPPFQLRSAPSGSRPRGRREVSRRGCRTSWDLHARRVRRNGWRDPPLSAGPGKEGLWEAEEEEEEEEDGRVRLQPRRPKAGRRNLDGLRLRGREEDHCFLLTMRSNTCGPPGSQNSSFAWKLHVQLLLLGFLLPTWLGAVEIKVSEEPMVALVGHDAVLHCSFSPEANFSLNELSLFWQVTDTNQLVHSFMEGQDQPAYQGSTYANRTALFYDQLAHGNMSLLLRRVQISDEGSFTCFVKVRDFSRAAVTLQIAATYSKPNVNLEPSKNLKPGDLVKVRCHSFSGYPEAVVLWQDGHGNNITDNITTSQVANEQGLFDVQSILQVVLEPNSTYSCLIKNPLLQEVTHASVSITGQHLLFPAVALWVTVGLSICLVVLLIVLAYVCQKKIRQSCKEEKAKAALQPLKNMDVKEGNQRKA